MKLLLPLFFLMCCCAGYTCAQTTVTFPIPECTPVAVEEKAAAIQELHLFPNPVEESLSIKFSMENNHILEYSISNIIGQVLIKGAIKKDETTGNHPDPQVGQVTRRETIEVSRLESGVYIFSLIAPEGLIKKKFIIK